MPHNVLIVNNWRNVLKDELDVIEELMFEAVDKVVDLLCLEEEMQDLILVFFCHHGKFPDEV